MTHPSPPGGFCWGWACSRRAGSPPAAACHTCPGCPGTACALPSWSCPCSHPAIRYRVSFPGWKLIMYKPPVIRSKSALEIFLCKKRNTNLILYTHYFACSPGDKSRSMEMTVKWRFILFSIRCFKRICWCKNWFFKVHIYTHLNTSRTMRGKRKVWKQF